MARGACCLLHKSRVTSQKSQVAGSHSGSHKSLGSRLKGESSGKGHSDSHPQGSRERGRVSSREGSVGSDRTAAIKPQVASLAGAHWALCHCVTIHAVRLRSCTLYLVLNEGAKLNSMMRPHACLTSAVSWRYSGNSDGWVSS